MTAPIVLFVRDQPERASMTLAALRANSIAAESDLIVYSDGTGTHGDLARIGEVRAMVRAAAGFRSVRVVECDDRRGSAHHIIDGISTACARYGRAIVLNDDLVTSPWFLKFMNEALDLYAADDTVGAVSGYAIPTRQALPETFFIRGAACCGWATWQRAWKHFNADSQALLQQLEQRGSRSELDIDGAVPYSGRLSALIHGEVHSWVIRWHASAFRSGLLTLYPGRSLVRIIDIDALGPHCGTGDRHDIVLAQTPIRLDPSAEVRESTVARQAVKQLLSPPALHAPRRAPVKALAKRFLKRPLVKLLSRLSQLPPSRSGGVAKPGLRLDGPFPTWAAASERAGGYDQPAILDRVAHATLAVRDGRAVFERDSVLFDRIEYSWPVLSALMQAAALGAGRLHVLDFGGSLGSSFFQNRRFLSDLPDVRWGVVEQADFVAVGQRELQDERLHFFEDIASCAGAIAPNVALLGSVLQYLPDPHAILAELMQCKTVRCIIVDRTALGAGDADLPMLQFVPPSIYEATYPCWILSEAKLRSTFAEGWRLLEDFQAADSLPSPVPVSWKGMIYVRK